VADLPIDFSGDLADRLLDALDREGKIARALETLGPIAERDLFVVDPADGVRSAELGRAGARLVGAAGERSRRRTAGREGSGPTLADLRDGSVDVVVGYWSAFRAPSEEPVAEADRVLRPGGRLLVVHDYGRDDVSRLRGELPEYGRWSKRDGWYLEAGFRMRVIHCFWTFDTLEAMRVFLVDGFGEVGATVAETLKRPRLSYNVAVYHRSRGDLPARGV
jgi:SAM-dependent methyltransferase